MVVVTPTKKAWILHMREDGSTFREIGNRLGIIASMVQRNFEKLGENCNIYTYMSLLTVVVAHAFSQPLTAGFVLERFALGWRRLLQTFSATISLKPANAQCIETAQKKVFLVDECARSFF